jgi:hypothetical protein
MRPIRLSRNRGSTMALYATFLALVGIPLLALNVDVARVYVAKARLRSATQAACQAYGGMLDLESFRESGKWQFRGDAMAMAYRIFYQSSPTGASVGITVTEKYIGTKNHLLALKTTAYGSEYPEKVLP